MIRTANKARKIALAAGTALASLALTGCASTQAPRADLSASQAEAALAKGEHKDAVEHAEAAVLADPRNPAFRAMLGAAYLDGGRFNAAATSFADAMALGDESARTALGLALAQIGSGDHFAAAALLDDWHGDIAAADLGLALALTGQPERGVHVLSNAIRNGENSPKVRQNLAYAYALQGNWRAARIMVAEDVPADKVGDRIAEWASTIRPEYFQVRVANLLGAPLVADAGQSAQLALANFPGIEQLAAEAVAAPAASAAPVPDEEFALAEPAELPAMIAPAPSEGIRDTAPEAPAQALPQIAEAPAPTIAASPAGGVLAAAVQGAVDFFSAPMVQAVPAKRASAAPAAPSVAAAPSQRRVATSKPAAARGNHLVQLGSFTSQTDARRAWNVFTDRYAQLSGREMVMTEARVNGKTYFRVSAGGFEQASASALCRTVKARGEGCIAWAKGSPLPGAVDKGVRMASR